MNKAQLMDKAKELGVAVDESMTNAQIKDLLSQVEGSLKNSPESSVRSQSGGPKSKMSEHAKFSKFKNKKRGS